MKKFFVSKHFSIFAVVLLLLVGISLIWQFTNPATSKAQTYSSINCPTPAPGKNVLQLVPCTPSGTISSAPFAPTSSTQQTQQTAPTSANTVPAPTTASSQQTGPVCTPDSLVGNGSACKCQEDLEADAICTVPSEADCVHNGGTTGPNLQIITSGLGGAQMKLPTGPAGSATCLWLGSKPVPAAANATNCSVECNSKPVIYFYSPTTLSVNVTLDIPGFVTTSIPHYPTNGWKNVIVHPNGSSDGTLLYNNQTYNELYYEDATIKAQPPTQGFIIKTSDLKNSLRTYTTDLGLNTTEQNEFLSYWVPRLTDLHAPYIFFTVFDQTQKEKVDHVIVEPQPTTTIAFLAYFKPLNSPINVQPLPFSAVPKRNGFTMVEWGGTIDEH